MITKYLYRLSFLLRPNFWYMQNRYSEDWDQMLNSMLDKPVFNHTGAHTTTLNGKQIWIANYPHAFASPYDPEINVRPRRETIVRLRKELDKHLLGG